MRSADDTIISADNFYNPFGIDFGGVAGVNPNAAVPPRGARHSREQRRRPTRHSQTSGCAGKIGQSGWQWDLTAGIGRMDQDTNIARLSAEEQLATRVGPVVPAIDGTIVCGQPVGGVVPAANIIGGCVPLNIFNLEAAGAGRSAEPDQHELPARTTTTAARATA